MKDVWLGIYGLPQQRICFVGSVSLSPLAELLNQWRKDDVVVDEHSADEEGEAKQMKRLKLLPSERD